MGLRASSAFQTLVALDTYCRQSDRRLPSEDQVVPTVSVVCFALQGQQFAVPFSDIVELLEVPACTRLPRVQNWVRGVANVRGRLLPIIDLAEFVGARLSTAPR
ncbi:MAG: chemotaxis protein CheW, partial [Porticoccaceae bacterium]|nr:chemotaxis protein CheW [Porticoccaceae bacterium]